MTVILETDLAGMYENPMHVSRLYKSFRIQYPNKIPPKNYVFKDRNEAYKFYIKHVGSEIKDQKDYSLDPKYSMRFQITPYNQMPRVRGVISPIADIRNSYTVIFHRNERYNKLIVGLFNSYVIRYKIFDIDDLISEPSNTPDSRVLQIYLNSLIHIMKHETDISLCLSNLIIGVPLMNGLLYKLKSQKIAFKYQELWQEIETLSRTHNIQFNCCEENTTIKEITQVLKHYLFKNSYTELKEKYTNNLEESKLFDKDAREYFNSYYTIEKYPTFVKELDDY